MKNLFVKGICASAAYLMLSSFSNSAPSSSQNHLLSGSFITQPQQDTTRHHGKNKMNKMSSDSSNSSKSGKWGGKKGKAGKMGTQGSDTTTHK